MGDTTFERAVNWLYTVEGFESNDPADAGGYTKYGISSKYHPNIDIKSLTWDAAKRIYKREYWDKYAANLPYPLNVVIFDTAVNLGGDDVVWMLPAAKAQSSDPNIQAVLIILFRLAKYVARANTRVSQRKFLRGWVNRLISLARFINVINE